MTNTEISYWWLIFYQNRLLLGKNDNIFSIPTGENVPVTIPKGTTAYTISTATGMVCKTFYTDSPIAEIPEYMQVGLRTPYDCLSQERYQAVGGVHKTLYWDRGNRYYPTCETPLVQKEPIMKKCPNCGREIYLVILAAILVLVHKEGSPLLVHARSFKSTFNSLIARFPETGETLGKCVVKEVKEETGLDVRNTHYFGSQPWPYSNELIVGLITDYVSGNIHLQDDKLSSGNLYTRDYLPELPRKLSPVRKMID